MGENKKPGVGRAFKQKKAFIAFITAGDPTIEITERLIQEMERAGADLIEIGIPFSDPVAEGPVIQGANERALEKGCTTDDIFNMVKRIRKQVRVPLVFLTYVNPIIVYGAEKFVNRCVECGVEGLIIPDLPFEEKGELREMLMEKEVELISLITPTSEERISMIAKEAQGFLYIVSSLGVTGVRSEIKTNIGEMVQKVKQYSDVPCAVGFGISTTEQVREMTQVADGAIVGSAIVKIIEKYGENCITPVCEYVKEMKQSVSTCE